MKNLRKMVAVSLLSLVAGVVSAANEKPNVIIIYGDDIGDGDIGVNGSKMIRRTYIDRPAAGGLNFTDGRRSASTCSPSRFSMLTGILAVCRDVRIPGPTSALPITEEDFILPMLSRQVGYATAAIGKWHLGLGQNDGSVDGNTDIETGPLEIGFDDAFLVQNTGVRVPCVYLENHRIVNLDPEDPLFSEEKVAPTSLDPFPPMQRKAFNGLCLAIIRSTKTPGTIQLKASSEGLESASVTITSK